MRGAGPGPSPAAASSACTNLTVDAAAGHIFGYTIMNDWSARDLQAREMAVRLGPAKGKDFGMSLGPWIVTADELEPSRAADGFLALRAEVYRIGELVGTVGQPVAAPVVPPARVRSRQRVRVRVR